MQKDNNDTNHQLAVGEYLNKTELDLQPPLLYTKNGIINDPAIISRFIIRQNQGSANIVDSFLLTSKKNFNAYMRISYTGGDSATVRIREFDLGDTLIKRTGVIDNGNGNLLLKSRDTSFVGFIPGDNEPCGPLVRSVFRDNIFIYGYQWVIQYPLTISGNGNLSVNYINILAFRTYGLGGYCRTIMLNTLSAFNESSINLMQSGDTLLIQKMKMPFNKL